MKTPRAPHSLALSTLAAALVLGGFAQAGTLSFTPLANDAAAVNIKTTNTYTHTVNFNASAAAIINGVSFAPGTQTGANYTLTGAGNAFTNNTQAEIASGGAGLNALGDTFYYGGPIEVLTLTGLTPGYTYRTGMLVFGWDNSNQIMTVSDDPSVSHTFDRDGNTGAAATTPVAIEYLFTAPSSGQIVYTITEATTGNSLHNYGFYNQLVAVPEPATAGFLAFAAGAFLRRRRAA